MENEFLSLHLPSGLLDIFTIKYYCSFSKLDTREEGYFIHLEEKNILPEGYISSEFESKGFDPPVLVQDFPIRGKLVFLSIRKRRWRHKTQKSEIVKRAHSFIAVGLQMTVDLSAFLKDTGREPSRYNVEYL